MNTFVIDLPRSYYRPQPPAPGLYGPLRQPPALTWLALALALALAGLVVANLVMAAGLATVVTALNLATVPACIGLGIAVALFYLEVTWSARV